MKFQSHLIKNLLYNQGCCIENVIRAIHPSERVVIAQGYGAAEQVPMRFLAYAVPVLRLAMQMSEKTIVEFYIASHGVHRANGVYHRESVEIMKSELRWLVEVRYPQLAERVRILEDGPLSEEGEEIMNLLLPAAHIVVENNPQIKQFLSNRGGSNAIRYMAEHLLYMRDPILVDAKKNTELLVPQMCAKFDHVIMVGGPAEKVFWQFRQEMLKLCGSHNDWKSYQFFTPVGDPPTYHVYDGEPVIGGKDGENLFFNLKGLLNEFGKQKNVVRDYSILLQDLLGAETFKLPHEIEDSILIKGEEAILSRY